jgi:hypothetical protein
MRFFKVLLAVVALGVVLVPNAMAFRFDDASRMPPTGQTGQSYYHRFQTVAGCKGVSIRVSAGSLPPGLVLAGYVQTDEEGSNWHLEGTPTVPGEYTFELELTNLCPADRVQETITVRVVQGLGIVEAALPPGAVNKPYSAKLTAAGGGTQTWSATGLPDGLVMGSDGTISGTPKAHTGGQTVTVTVTDGSRSSSRSYQIAIRNPVDIPAVTVPVVGINRAFSQVVRASGGNEAYTWTLEGQIPPGLAIAPAPTDKFAAVISGTPTSAGTYNVIVKATDSELNFFTRTVTITVAAPVSITTTKLAALKVGRQYSLTVKTKGGLPWVRNGLNTFKWSVVPGGKLPTGLRLNTQTGKLIGTARTAGTYRFTLSVRDKFGTVDTQAFKVVVK